MTAWTDNKFILIHTPLSQVAEELNRYSGRQIRGDSLAGDLRVSGVFSTSDPRDILSLLPSVVPVTVNFHADGTVTISFHNPQRMLSPQSAHRKEKTYK
ncbi:ferric-dicitrate binding protein FerR (iron transport regulator) [Paraburkholderia caledonica]|uniref:Ferric-dicitrate binding protein FerR (Iron transport regulator) n=1 Tax=Paraburkholderia caledonica TaxID=134536 RepID=A0AB73INN8_9BURK|nr:ferric-dicitrate binding protein FerR (iron transport regulator) [Paraburkholderia caledonica]